MKARLRSVSTPQFRNVQIPCLAEVSQGDFVGHPTSAKALFCPAEGAGGQRVSRGRRHQGAEPWLHASVPAGCRRGRSCSADASSSPPAETMHRAFGRGFRDRAPLRRGAQGRWGCSISCPRLCLRARAQPKQTYSSLVPPPSLKNKAHGGIYLEVY